MLGDLLTGLTDATRVEEFLAIVGSPQIMERVAAHAVAEGIETCELVASRVRHLLDHGGEDVWLDLMGVMANSPQPASAAIELVLARSFPAPAVHARGTLPR